MTPSPRGIDHVALNVPDVPAALTFYTEVLGLTQRDDRPDFGIAGAWLNAGHQQVHLIELPPPSSMVFVERKRESSVHSAAKPKIRAEKAITTSDVHRPAGWHKSPIVTRAET